jgi:hypothetical protein
MVWCRCLNNCIMNKINLRMSDRCSWMAVASWVVVLSALTLAGCGSRGPHVQFVEGIVLLDGQPVDGAMVFFIPHAERGETTNGLPAAGRTKADGTFQLNASAGARAGAGTAIGTYAVTVVKQEGPPIPEPDASGFLPPAPPNMVVRDVVPKVYGAADTSPLRAEVAAGKNRFRFELESSARSGKPR